MVINSQMYRRVGDGAVTERNVEELLDSGMIEARMWHGKWWRLRRNGATKRWKTRPSEFKIPTKAGLKSFGYITHEDFV